MSACDNTRNVDLHFEGRLSIEAERRMRVHLDACAQCRDRYDRWALLTRLDPSAVSVEERIARGLGLRRPTPFRRAAAAAAPLLLAAVALLSFRLDADREFVPRGSVATSDRAPVESSVRVYRVARDDEALPAIDVVSRGDALAFRYENGLRKAYLMIFAIDEHSHVYWFYPAWKDEADDPSSIPIESTPGVHDLREAVVHRFDGHRLEVHALFTDEARRVGEIERALRAGAADSAAFSSPASAHQTFVLEVTP